MITTDEIRNVGCKIIEIRGRETNYYQTIKLDEVLKALTKILDREDKREQKEIEEQIKMAIKIGDYIFEKKLYKNGKCRVLPYSFVKRIGNTTEFKKWDSENND